MRCHAGSCGAMRCHEAARSGGGGGGGCGHSPGVTSRQRLCEQGRGGVSHLELIVVDMGAHVKVLGVP